MSAQTREQKKRKPTVYHFIAGKRENRSKTIKDIVKKIRGTPIGGINIAETKVRPDPGRMIKRKSKPALCAFYTESREKGGEEDAIPTRRTRGVKADLSSKTD